MCIAGFDVVDIISMLLAVSVGLFASSLYYRYKVHAIQRNAQGVKTPSFTKPRPKYTWENLKDQYGF